MTPYTKNKKVHKLVRVYSALWNWVNVPVCRIDNTTHSYDGDTSWAKTTCKKCLEKKP